MSLSRRQLLQGAAAAPIVASSVPPSATAAPPAGTPLPLLEHKDEIYRELCERSLYHFIKHFWAEMDPSPFLDGWHIEAICEHLEAVTNGQIKRLVINIPPRHMKSLAIVGWSAWTWAQKMTDVRPLAGPDTRFLSASYAYSLAVRDNRKTRLLLQSPRYRRYWGDRVKLTGDQNAKARFENTEAGYRLVTSVEGFATGEGGDICIVDDPISAGDAKREVARNTVIDWWTQVMPTRLNNPVTGAYVIIMQRLHHQDLTEHVLEQETGWTHLCLPARYEHDHPRVYAFDKRKIDGELLWPSRFPEETIASLEEVMGSYAAAGQLQQRPAPREGGLFKRGDFKSVEEVPDGGTDGRGWDLAGTDKKTSPWTVGLRMKRVGRSYYIYHVERFRGSPQEVESRFVNITKSDGHNTVQDIPQDPGSAGKFQARYLVGLVPGYVARFSPETGSKASRAEPLSAQVEAGNVYLCLPDKIKRTMLDEFEQFPLSDFSDQVDAASRIFARLTRREQPIAAGPILLDSS